MAWVTVGRGPTLGLPDRPLARNARTAQFPADAHDADVVVSASTSGWRAAGDLDGAQPSAVHLAGQERLGWRSLGVAVAEGVDRLDRRCESLFQHVFAAGAEGEREPVTLEVLALADDLNVDLGRPVGLG
jgi:hypothetical protein